MKVSRMIEMLKELDPDLEVEAWDPEEENWVPITGCLSDDKTAMFYTDEP